MKGFFSFIFSVVEVYLHNTLQNSIKSKVETAPISKFSITYALSLLEKAKSGSEVSVKTLNIYKY
jgi:hypothetical protein